MTHREVIHAEQSYRSGRQPCHWQQHGHPVTTPMTCRVLMNFNPITDRASRCSVVGCSVWDIAQKKRKKKRKKRKATEKKCLIFTVLSVYINVIYWNLPKYIYGCGGARTCVHCLVVRRSRPVADKVRNVNEMLVRSRRVQATKGGWGSPPRRLDVCLSGPVPHGSAAGQRRQPGWLDLTKGQLPLTSPLALFSNGGERERERERESHVYAFFFRTLHLTVSSKTTSFQRGLRFFLVSA